MDEAERVRGQIKAIIAVLKKRFNSLTTDETVDLAFAIYDAIKGVR